MIIIWILSKMLVECIDLEKRVAKYYTGTQNIINTLSGLPSTSHPINESPTKKLFLVDAFQNTSGPVPLLYIHVHGEFKLSSGTKLSFDRTFVLQPSAPVSRAAQSNIPVTIVNDMLVLRQYAGNDAWVNASSVQKNQYPQLPDEATLQTYKLQFQLVIYLDVE